MSTKDKVLRELQSRPHVKLKEERPGQYRGNNPFDMGSDSKAFTFSIESAEYGKWQDFVTGEKGSLYDLADKLGIDRPGGNGASKPIDKTGMDTVPDEPPSIDVVTTAPKKSLQTFETLAEYSAHQGVPVEAFIKAKCHIVQWGGKPHIAFPCSDGYNRLRVMDDRKPKWYPQKKRDDKTKLSPQLYLLKRAVVINKEEGSPFVLCNGQPSVIVAQHHGIAAFCLTDGEGRDIPDAALLTIRDAIKKYNVELYIAKDNDKAGRAGAKRSYDQLWECEPKMIVFTGDEGYDLANHCKKWGDDSLKELLKLEKPVQRDVPAEQVDDLVKAITQLTRAQNRNDKNAIQSQMERLRKRVDVVESENPSIDLTYNPIMSAYTQFNERLMKPRAITGFKCGIKDIDYAIAGFNRGSPYRILASTSAGKSLLCATFGYSFATQAPGMIVTYESGYRDFIFRMVAAETHIPFGDIKRAGQMVEVNGAFDFKKLNPIKVGDVQCSFGALSKLQRDKRLVFQKRVPKNPHALYPFIEKCKEVFGIEWLIIDSLNNMRVPGAGQQESMAVAAINSESMAVDFDLAVLDTVQPGRATKGRDDKHLNVDDGKWSSEIEEKAEVLFALYNHWALVDRGDITYNSPDDKRRAEEDHPRNSATLTILKTRGNGTVGREMRIGYAPGAGFYNWKNTQGNE